VRAFLAISTAVLLLLGAVTPHHHAATGGAHECVACTVGGSLEARDATPTLSPPLPGPVAVAVDPAEVPGTGFPLGAVPGQSPPVA
jgi:hypothetical protein